MARIKDRQKAIELRKQGRTYSEIKKLLKVPKSTLSGWLSQYPLTQRQFEKLVKTTQKRKFAAIEKTRATKARKRQERFNKIYQQEYKELLPLNKRELYLCGLFLYWGEGVKGFNTIISVNNTDPKVLKFFYRWLTEALKVQKKEIRVYTHLYDDMDIETTLQFWSRYLKIPRAQFTKPYIKKSTRRYIDHKGFGHGTCGLRVCDARLKEKIALGIQGIADYYAGQLKRKLL